LAVIGRHAAVADLGALHFDGFVAWLLWLLIHIYYLIGFENKLLVMIQWGWNYVTRTRGAQLITGQDPSPFVELRTGSAGDVRPLAWGATTGDGMRSGDGRRDGVAQSASQPSR
jgi:NADH dehydrogenase